MSTVQNCVYRPDIYEVETLDQAKDITITPEADTTTEERWRKETAYLTEEIGRQLELGRDDCVLDFGCGTGRLSKALIEAYGCRAIGVDASKSMRLLSPEYVLSDRFTVWSPDVLVKMVDKGFRFKHAICLWVLQHVFDPRETIELIDRALAPGARLFVLNHVARCVPTNMGYVNDGKDVQAELKSRFDLRETHSLPSEVTTKGISEISRIYLLNKSVR